MMCTMEDFAVITIDQYEKFQVCTERKISFLGMGLDNSFLSLAIYKIERSLLLFSITFEGIMSEKFQRNPNNLYCFMKLSRDSDRL